MHSLGQFEGIVEHNGLASLPQHTDFATIGLFLCERLAIIALIAGL